MKKILCPTDFSDAAGNAVQYAAKLAQKLEAKLTLINVQVLAELTLEQAAWGEDMNFQAATSRLSELSEEVSKVFKITCDFEVETAAAGITNMLNARAKNYDLIVMGTQGTHSLSELFFGTHTYQVIRKTAIPVLLVPETCDYSEIKKITFAFDYLHAQQLPLVQLAKFARKLESELNVLQIVEESYTYAREQKLKEIQQSIKSLYAEKELAILFNTIYTTDLASGINGFVLQNQPDLLALCAVHHSFIEKIFHKSVIKTIAGIASYPVFVFH